MRHFKLTMYRGRWAASFRDGGRTRRISLRTRDRHLAEQRLEKLKAEDRAGYRKISAIIDSKIEQDASFKYHLKAPRDFFGEFQPEYVTEETCGKYISHRRASGKSDWTIRKELGMLAATLRSHDKDTPATFKLPPQPAPRDRYLTRDEYNHLLDGAASDHVRLFIILALNTAGRKQALLDLTWDRVDFQRGLIALRNPDKHGKTRATVPMNNALKATLEDAHKIRTCDYVIEYGSGKVKSVRKGFEAACNRAGLKNVTPHVLRHTAAVWMAESGVNIQEIAQFLGHSSPNITWRVYAKYSPDYLKSAASALEGVNE